MEVGKEKKTFQNTIFFLLLLSVRSLVARVFNHCLADEKKKKSFQPQKHWSKILIWIFWFSNLGVVVFRVLFARATLQPVNVAPFHQMYSDKQSQTEQEQQ